MNNLGFDPAARVHTRELDGLYETTLKEMPDGSFLLVFHDETGWEIGTAEFRAGFLDAFIAARAAAAA